MLKKQDIGTPSGGRRENIRWPSIPPGGLWPSTPTKKQIVDWPPKRPQRTGSRRLSQRPITWQSGRTTAVGFGGVQGVFSHIHTPCGGGVDRAFYAWHTHSCTVTPCRSSRNAPRRQVPALPHAEG